MTRRVATRLFISLIKKSLLILILHGDYVFISIVYSWPAGPHMRGSTVPNQNKKTTLQKARQKRNGLNHDGRLAKYIVQVKKSWNFIAIFKFLNEKIHGIIIITLTSKLGV